MVGPFLFLSGFFSRVSRPALGPPNWLVMRMSFKEAIAPLNVDGGCLPYQIQDQHKDRRK